MLDVSGWRSLRAPPLPGVPSFGQKLLLVTQPGAVFPPRALFLLDRPMPRAGSGRLVGKADAGRSAGSLTGLGAWRGDLSPSSSEGVPAATGAALGSSGAP